jgi:hypothetical protein
MSSTLAKPTFGTLKQLSYQSDYIRNKKSKLAYCNIDNKCKKNISVPSYNQYNLFNNGRYLNDLVRCNISSFNKTDLIAGLYSKMNLTNVCSVVNGNPCSNLTNCDGCDSPAKINACSEVPFYQTNTIDPVGELFGNTICGVNNFTNYMEYDNQIVNNK